MLQGWSSLRCPNPPTLHYHQHHCHTQMALKCVRCHQVTVVSLLELAGWSVRGLSSLVWAPSSITALWQAILAPDPPLRPTAVPLSGITGLKTMQHCFQLKRCVVQDRNSNRHMTFSKNWIYQNSKMYQNSTICIWHAIRHRVQYSYEWYNWLCPEVQTQFAIVQNPYLHEQLLFIGWIWTSTGANIPWDVTH